MRKAGLDIPLTRDDVKVGDKIRIVREVTVKSVRPVELGGGVGASVVIEAEVPAGAIGDSGDSLALTHKESLTLLERNLSLEIPEDAKVVTWSDSDGATHYAAIDSNGEWDNGEGDWIQDNEQLETHILGSGYEEGTFKVIHPAPKPKLSTGGYVRPFGELSTPAMDSLRSYAKSYLALPPFSPRGVVG